MGRVTKEDLDNFDEYYRQYKQIFGNELNEDFKSGLKKAGKFAKGAIAGAAMAGALAGNAHGMEDPYYDGATQPFDEAENSDEKCDSCEDEQMKRIKEKHNKLKKDFADYKNKKEVDKEELFEKDDEEYYPQSEGWFPRWVFDTASDEHLYALINDPRSQPKLIQLCKEILNDRKSSKKEVDNSYEDSKSKDFDDEITETLRIAGIKI